MTKSTDVLKCLLLLFGIFMYSSTAANQPLSKEGTESSMVYPSIKREKMYVVGIAIETSNKDGRFQKEVPPLWDRFFREKIADKIKNRKNQNLLAIYTDYHGDYTQPFTYLIGYEVSDLDRVPEGLIGKEIEASSFAIFTAKGQFPQSVARIWQNIWNSKMTRLYATDFEVYPADFNPQANPEVNIYISIQ